VASRAEWPPVNQIAQLRLQLGLLHAWAMSEANPAVRLKRRAASA
jgi:hypothetical protein